MSLFEVLKTTVFTTEIMSIEITRVESFAPQEYERLGYDSRDLKVQALIFPQLHPNATVHGSRVVQCVEMNTIMYTGLVATMEMTVSNVLGDFVGKDSDDDLDTNVDDHVMRATR